MFNQIFVDYLTQKNTIAPEQAREVLAIQNNTKIRIGVLAIEEKLMTLGQVDEVNRLQAAKNARFGDIAVEKGYLTQEQLDTLLKKQPREHIILKQVICDKQYMEPGQFDTALNDFKSELGVDNGQFENLTDNDIDTYLSCIAGLDSGDVLMWEYARIFIATTIRCVDREFFVKKAGKNPFTTSRFVFGQDVKGDADAKLIISAEDSDSATKFAEKFSKDVFEPSDELDDDVKDAVKEFLNCVNGLLISELSNSGKMELDLEIPEYYDKLSVDPETVIFPFSLLDIGEFDIFIKKN
jgi:CheY-specific phosphatase CheX